MPNKKANSAECGGCSMIVKEKDSAVECDGCKAWFHIRCGKISNQIYKGMQDLKDGKELIWFCSRCVQDICGGFRDKIIAINQRMEGLEREKK